MGADRKPFVRPCCALLPALAAITIAACGSSSPTASSSSATPLAVHSRPGDSNRGSTHGDIVSTGTVTQRPMRGTGGGETNDENRRRTGSGSGTATAGSNPCVLVSKAQAQAIVGAPIATPQEAPMGPTCIYQRRGGGDLITVAVESLEFAKIRSKLRGGMRATLGGRTAYCGNYGHPTTFVPLAHGRVLNVTAPCTVGTRLAGKALSRLKD